MPSCGEKPDLEKLRSVMEESRWDHPTGVFKSPGHPEVMTEEAPFSYQRRENFPGTGGRIFRASIP